MKIKLNVNQENMMEVFGQSFRSNEAVVVELIQNARRAGATDIDLTIYDDYLCVMDNGRGITDWSDLLSIYQSGWKIENEIPFGVGLKGALFICDQLTVHSKGLGFSEPCEDIKAFKAIEVEPVLVQTSMSCWTTIVALDGFAGISLPQLLKMLDGFPVPIKIKVGSTDDFRIIEVDRRNAKTDAFARTSFGWIESGYTPGHGVLSKNLYYLGVRIGLSDNDWRYNGNGPVVHLDPTLFKPTLPDRALLTGESVERLQEMAEQWRGETFRDEARIRHADSDCDWLIDNYRYLKDFDCLHFLNDYPALGGGIITQLDDVRNAAYHDGIYSSLDDIPVDEVFVLDDKTRSLPEFDPQEADWSRNSLVAVYACEKEIVFLTEELDPEHPVYKPDRLFDPESVKVLQIENPVKVEWGNIALLWEIDERTPVLCDWVRLDGPAGEVVVHSTVIVTDDEVLIPKNVDPWSAALQIGELWSEEVDGYSEDRREEVAGQIRVWLDRLQATSPAQVFWHVINESACRPPDGTFLVVTKGGLLVSVEEVDQG